MAQQAIHKFILGTKELEGKNTEFQYDRGWYSITDIVGETRNTVYRSRNAQEAYMKWNVYIGRKKERPHSESRARNESAEGASHGNGNRGERSGRHSGEERRKSERQESRSRRENKGGENRQRGGANRRRYDSRFGAKAEG